MSVYSVILRSPVSFCFARSCTVEWQLTWLDLIFMQRSHIFLRVIMNFSHKLKQLQLERAYLCLSSRHLQWIVVCLPPFTSFCDDLCICVNCFSSCLNAASTTLHLNNKSRAETSCFVRTPRARITSLHTTFGGGVPSKELRLRWSKGQKNGSFWRNPLQLNQRLTNV